MRTIRPVLFLVVLSLAACGKKASTPAPAPSSPPAAAAVPADGSLDGSWEGNSGPDLPVSFTVEGQKVTFANASYAGHKDGGCSFNGNMGSDGPAAIDGKTFTATGKREDGTQFTLTGSFSSATEASGSLVWKIQSEICGPSDLTYQWKAKRSAEPAE